MNFFLWDVFIYQLNFVTNWVKNREEWHLNEFTTQGFKDLSLVNHDLHLIYIQI